MSLPDGHLQLNLSDLHIPYHDDYAWELVIRLAEDLQPDAVNLLGDMLDCHALGPFPKDPAYFKRDGLQKDLSTWFRLMKELRRALHPAAKINFVPGNHEDWLRRWLWTHPEVADLENLQLEKLLRLEELGIEATMPDYTEGEEAELLLAPGLLGLHGDYVGKHAGQSVQKQLENDGYGMSMVIGHCHRQAAIARTTRHGVIYGFENGCLCQIQSRTWTKRPNWQLGITATTRYYSGVWQTDLLPFVRTKNRLTTAIFGQEFSV